MINYHSIVKYRVFKTVYNNSGTRSGIRSQVLQGAGSMSDLTLILIFQFATWSRLNSSDNQLISQCFTALHYSPVADDVADVAQTAADVFKFVTAFRG